MKNKLTADQLKIVRQSIATQKEKILDEGHGPWVDDLNKLSDVEQITCGSL